MATVDGRRKPLFGANRDRGATALRSATDGRKGFLIAGLDGPDKPGARPGVTI
jgi:hypothetical protein